MSKIAAVGLGFGLSFGLTLALAISVPAVAQDIPGVEDCTKTSGLDKRTGCLQSNVNFLQQLVTRNALDARQRLSTAGTEIAALKTEIAGLKSALAGLQTSVEQLRAALKAAGEKKPEAK
jgi:prophage DNA circulation protein